jgi:hypothetical protein
MTRRELFRAVSVATVAALPVQDEAESMIIAKCIDWGVILKSTGVPIGMPVHPVLTDPLVSAV